MDVMFEKYGITLSFPWKGKPLRLGVGLSEAIGYVSNDIGECDDNWKLLRLLKLAENHEAELDKVYTDKNKIYVALNFRSNTQLEEFSEELKQL